MITRPHHGKTSGPPHPSLFYLTCRFPTSLSLNLAILSSVVLASRLPSTTTVFSYLLFSVQWFALFPLFRRYLLQYNPIAFHTLTVILFLAGVACVAWIGKGNWLAGAVWGGVVGGGVGIGCPLGLIWLQKYKKYPLPSSGEMLIFSEIHGPWDVARPQFKHAST
jgi:phosphatidylinositol glycan class C protein